MSTELLVKPSCAASPLATAESVPRRTAPTTDRSFADPSWQVAPWSTLVGLWRAWATAEETLADALPAGEFRPMLELDVNLLTNMLAPSNFIATNPVALKHAVETGGQSIVDAISNFMHDELTGQVLPALGNTSKYVVGETVAITPGSVVYRDERMEVLHYAGQTAEVNAQPVLFVPPQINRFYVIDIEPGRSLVEYMVQHGVDTYTIVWRNPDCGIPGATQWDFDWYIRGMLKAMELVNNLSSSPQLSVMAACAGGMTLLEALSYLASHGDHSISSLVLLVTMVDTSANAESAMGKMMSPTLIGMAPPLLDLIGMEPGISNALGFRVAQPAQTIWPQWINQWVLGNEPACDALLAWNMDPTNVSAGFIKDIVKMVTTNGLMTGAARVLGEPVNLRQISVPTLVVSGKTDNVSPWKGCYPVVHALGGTVEYIHTPTGHVQSVVFPPADPRCNYLTSDPHAAYPPTPDEWAAAATTVRQSWWLRLIDFLAEHGAGRVPASARATRVALDPAPGRYARE